MNKDILNQDSFYSLNSSTEVWHQAPFNDTYRQKKFYMPFSSHIDKNIFKSIVIFAVEKFNPFFNILSNLKIKILKFEEAIKQGFGYKTDFTKLDKKSIFELEKLFIRELKLKNYDNVNLLIEALGKNTDERSIRILEDLGTNSPVDFIRSCTAIALIRKNTTESLRLMVSRKGKGINDLSPKVCEITVNELLNLDDKTEALKVLRESIKMTSDKKVKINSRSVKTVLDLSN